VVSTRTPVVVGAVKVLVLTVLPAKSLRVAVPERGEVTVIPSVSL
jgi:hypothetical protein